MVSLQQIQRLEIMVTRLVGELGETRKQNQALKLRIENLENINRESDSNARKVEVGIQGVLDIISSVEDEDQETDDPSPSESSPAFESGEEKARVQNDPEPEIISSSPEKNPETRQDSASAEETSDSDDKNQPDETSNSTDEASSPDQPEEEKDSLTFSHPDDVPEEVDLDKTYPESEEEKPEFDLF